MLLPYFKLLFFPLIILILILILLNILHINNGLLFLIFAVFGAQFGVFGGLGEGREPDFVVFRVWGIGCRG